MDKDWYISYRFYDERYKQQYPKGKQVKVKGMNSFHVLADRRAATESLLQSTFDELKNLGYNPITNTVSKPIIASDTLSQYTPMLVALAEASKLLKLAGSTMADIDDTIKYITPAADKLGYSELNIIDISKKHIIKILEQAALKKDGSFSGHKYNKLRTYLRIIFEKLEENEVIPHNPVASTKKTFKGIIKKIRTTITEKEAVKALNHFSVTYPAFARFMHIFYHSGARKTELLHVKYADVNLQKQTVKLLVKKGKVYTEHLMPIKNVAMKYWVQAIANTAPGQYVFSKGFVGGEKELDADVIRKLWYRNAKLQLNIEADFYSLKHLHTTKMREVFSAEEVAKHNRHSIQMVNKVYDTKKKEREDLLIKNVKGELGE